MWNGFLFLLKYTWKFNKMYVFYAFSYQIVFSSLPLVNVIMPKFIIEELMGEQRVDTLLYLVGALVLVNCIGAILLSFLSSHMFTSKNIVFNKFQCFIAERLSRCDFEQLEDPEFLDIKEQAKKFLYANGQGFGVALDSAINILGKAFTFVGLIAVLSTLNLWIVLVFVGLVLLSSFVESRVRKKYTQLDLEKAPIERKTSYLINTIEDFTYGKDMRIYRAKDFFIDRVNLHLGESNRFYTKQSKLLCRSQYFSAVASLLRDGTAYAYLVYRVLSKAISIGDFTMYLGSVAQFSSAMIEVMQSVINIRQYEGYYDALNRYINMPSKMRNGNHKPLPAGQGYVIEFHDVSFRYAGQENDALKHINIRIVNGEKLSVVGENGAGKTTFVKLISRLYDPTEGYISLNGIDIREFDYEEYQSLISAVFQDFKLFSFTLKENIVFDQDETDEAVENCLIRSGFGDKLKTLKHGVNTYIHKNFESDGFEPSGGEGQKIAIARALYKNSPIVILDEPTAALDPRAEYEIYQHFSEIVEGKTAIYISHRLSSAKFCDHIAVFRQGEIVEYGTHDLLMQRKGLYAELFQMQAQFFV